MRKKSNIKIIIGVIIVLTSLVLVLAAKKENKGVSPSSAAGAENQISQKLVVYKSPNCGCCSNYAAYMRKQGYDVEVVETKDIGEIKKKYGIPGEVESCHTTVAGDYVIEGHIPAEAVNKLLAEKPEIKGIAMPGMPQGSPGMPGAKRGQFTIYKFDDDGSSEVFMRL